MQRPSARSRQRIENAVVGRMPAEEHADSSYALESQTTAG
jgi:hypothetical protein